MRTISESEPVARKNYGCDACVWLTEYDWKELISLGLTFAERRAVIKARQNGWRIMKGEKHLQATIIGCENEIISWRAIPEIHAICLKYDIYEDAIC